MKIVLQKVDGATVEVGGAIIGQVGHGFLLLVCAMKADTEKDADVLIEKILKLRTFADEMEEQFFEVSIDEVGGEILVVSQFTLGASMKKGRRPDFGESMKPDEAEELYNYFVRQLKESGLKIETGEFGAMMEVSLVNSGPVTYILDSKDYA